ARDGRRGVQVRAVADGQVHDLDVEILVMGDDPLQAGGDRVAVGRQELAGRGHAADADQARSGGDAQVGVAGGGDAGDVGAVAERVERGRDVGGDVRVAEVLVGDGVEPVDKVWRNVGVLGVDARVDDGDADAAAVDHRKDGVGAQGGEHDVLERAVRGAQQGAVFQQFQQQDGTPARLTPV